MGPTKRQIVPAIAGIGHTVRHAGPRLRIVPNQSGRVPVPAATRDRDKRVPLKSLTDGNFVHSSIITDDRDRTTSVGLLVKGNVPLVELASRPAGGVLL
jgi:hypothetical protein